MCSSHVRTHQRTIAAGIPMRYAVVARKWKAIRTCVFMRPGQPSGTGLAFLHSRFRFSALYSRPERTFWWLHKPVECISRVRVQVACTSSSSTLAAWPAVNLFAQLLVLKDLFVDFIVAYNLWGDFRWFPRYSNLNTIMKINKNSTWRPTKAVHSSCKFF